MKQQYDFLCIGTKASDVCIRVKDSGIPLPILAIDHIPIYFEGTRQGKRVKPAWIKLDDAIGWYERERLVGTPKEIKRYTEALKALTSLRSQVIREWPDVQAKRLKGEQTA